MPCRTGQAGTAQGRRLLEAAAGCPARPCSAACLHMCVCTGVHACAHVHSNRIRAPSQELNGQAAGGLSVPVNKALSQWCSHANPILATLLGRDPQSRSFHKRGNFPGNEASAREARPGAKQAC